MVILQSILILIFTYIVVKRYLYSCFILQLEHYYLLRFIDWCYKNKTNKKLLATLCLSAISLILIVFIKSPRLYYYELILGLLTIPFIQYKQEKKRLRLTYRIWRLIIFSLIVVGVIFIITYFIFKNSFNLYDIILLNLLLDNLLVFNILMFGQLLVYPLEKYFQNQFIIKARNKIIDNPDLQVIGITGSYGKTSVKFICSHLLKRKFNVCMTPHSYNTTMGVTLTVNNYLKNIDDLFVCEMGACRVGEIKILCDIVFPKIGIISSIGPQHLETFHSIQNIIKTKFELIESLPQDGCAILNFDNYYIRNYKIKNKVKIVTYGIEQEEVDYYAYNIHYGIYGSSFEVRFPNQKHYLFKTRLLGKHNISNMLAGIALSDYFNMNIQKMIYAVQQIKPIEHRLELKNFPNYNIIDDSFNANVEGCSNALDILKDIDNKRIIITPGMVELGKSQYEENYRFGEKIAKVCDYVVLVGKKQTAPIYHALIDSQYPEENIFITNSFQIGFQHIINRFQNHFTVLVENDLPDNYNES